MAHDACTLASAPASLTAAHLGQRSTPSPFPQGRRCSSTQHSARAQTLNPVLRARTQGFWVRE
eukprot:2648564-Rhodomonas_salina.1